MGIAFEDMVTCLGQPDTDCCAQWPNIHWCRHWSQVCQLPAMQGCKAGVIVHKSWLYTTTRSGISHGSGAKALPVYTAYPSIVQTKTGSDKVRLRSSRKPVVRAFIAAVSPSLAPSLSSSEDTAYSVNWLCLKSLTRCSHAITCNMSCG